MLSRSAQYEALVARSYNFHLEEYKQIRAEVGVLLARIENLFRYSMIVTATVYAWLIVQAVGLTSGGAPCLKLPFSLLLPAWLIPPAFVLIAGVLAFASFFRVVQMGQYLGMIEDKLGRSDLGWQKFLAEKWCVVTSTTVLAWLLLFGAAGYASLSGLAILGDHPAACKIEAARPTPAG